MVVKTYPQSRKELRGHLLWFLLWFAVTAVAIWLNPNPHGHGTHQQLGLPPCPSVLMFGRPCPGCGLTTSFTATVHGDIVHAFQANPFGPIVYIAFTISAIYCLVGFIKVVRFSVPPTKSYIGATTFIILYILFGTYRFMTTNPIQYARQYWRPGGVSTPAPTPAAQSPSTRR